MTVAAPTPALPGPPGVPTGDRWRWEARRRLTAVRDLLTRQGPPVYDGWLAAREARVGRERDLLLRRVAVVARLSHDRPEPVVRAELRRLAADVERYQQRVRDLQWDEVELEIGGSD